jgi:ribose 5-phosphate isomerase B
VKVAIASDHAGLALKLHLVQALAEAKIDYEDFGPSTAAVVDYPDYAKVVSDAVAGKKADFGVLCCGSGVGMSIAANKVKGVRAVLAHSELEARLSREHNDCNVLCLGERLIGPALARAILEVFLNAQFQGGRHADRLSKIE